MPFLACILPVVSCICEPVMSAAQSFLQTAVQDFLTSFRNWVVPQVRTLVTSCCGDFEEVPVSPPAVVGAEETLDEIRVNPPVSARTADFEEVPVSPPAVVGAEETLAEIRVNPPVSARTADFEEVPVSPPAVVGAEETLAEIRVNPPVSPRTADFVEVPESQTALVGAEETLDDIRAHLNDDDSVGIIGIHGMAGAGKTSLLRRINNDLFESRTAPGKFDLGIWVIVSKEVSIPAIQKQIARRLRITLSDDESQDATTLFQALSQRRFLVLLDDLWAKLELDRVGIPVPKKPPNCKIAFTTRNLGVCGDMDASCVTVKPLDADRSWELFCSKAGIEVDLNNSPIQRLTEQVVHKCGGLPLALITVGRAMANRRHPGDWKDAVDALDHKAEKLHGMDQVLSCLKLSYDYLKNDELRSALLYCAMYPEDTEIERDELIEHWIGEGMLADDDDDGGIDGARNRGHVLITDLQHSCLLEAGIRDAERFVRMHDAVRDLALWLNRTSCDKVDGFMAGEDLIKRAKPQRLEHARRIWMRNFSVSPPEVQNWPPNSWTLLLNESRLEPCLLRDIFNCMRTLRVLNLEDAKQLKELPIEIGLLQELKYLNLSSTGIRSLPKELGNLVRLRQLYLRHTSSLRRIPREAIVGLSRLQVLHMSFSDYEWRAQGETPAVEDRMVDDEENKQPSSSDTGAAEEGSGGRQLEVSDLEGLQQLQELEINLESLHALQQLSRSESLRRCTTFLDVVWEYQGDDGPLRMTFTQSFAQLRDLRLFGDRNHRSWVGEDGEDLRISLYRLPCLEKLSLCRFCCQTTRTIVLEGANAESFRTLQVTYSSGWKALELVGKFPGLEEIDVRECYGMEELLLDDSRFPKLKKIYFRKLRDLKSLGRRPLSFPSLESIQVESCPQLRRLELVGKFPGLEVIFLSKCYGMEELLLDEDNEGTGSQQDTIQQQLNDSRFPKLKSIYLLELRDLKSIGWRPLSFPSLECIRVESCPQLRRLELVGKFPGLEVIHVSKCEGMEELLLDEENEGTGSQQDTIQQQLNDSRFPKLNTILLDELTELKSIGRRPLSFPSLEYIDVRSCPQLRRLELVGKLPSLEVIQVIKCDGMEELLLDEENEGTGSQQDTIQEQLNDSRFPMLRKIYLLELRDLKSIGRRPLSLPSLEVIQVESCPQLRRLPLGRGSAPKLYYISGEQEWWDGLKWGSSGDDPNIRNIFAPFFSPIWSFSYFLLKSKNGGRTEESL